MKKQKLNSNTKKQMGTTNSVEGSKSPKVNADENIQRAVEILNEKDYAVKYDPNYVLNENKPTLNFGEFIHFDSFHEPPEKWDYVPKWDDVSKSVSEFHLAFDTANGNMQSAEFAKASVCLLKWAEELEHAIFSVFAIRAAFGEDRNSMEVMVARLFGLVNPKIEPAEDSGETDKQLGELFVYGRYRTPQAHLNFESKFDDLEKNEVHRYSYKRVPSTVK